MQSPLLRYVYMGVSKNHDTPKSSIWMGFSVINHPFWATPIFGNTHMMIKFNFLPFYLITHHCSLSTFTFKSPSFDGNKGVNFTISPSIPPKERYSLTSRDFVGVMSAWIKVFQFSRQVFSKRCLLQWSMCTNFSNGVTVCRTRDEGRSWLPRDPKARKHHPHPSCGKIMEIDHLQ